MFTTTLKDTIASGNRVEAASSSDPNNVVGTINVAGSKYNLVGPTNGIFPLVETNGNKHDTDNDPGLMPLLFNGGLTKTHMPIKQENNANDEVIDQGDSSAVAGEGPIPDFDQRGDPYIRVYDGNGIDGPRIDIGAVEYGVGAPTGAPRVVDIVISGSQSVHDEYSFSEAFDEGIHELTTVPVGGADTIEIVFSEAVFSKDPANPTQFVPLDASSLYIRNRYSGIDYTSDGSDAHHWKVVDYLYDDETFTARWRFDGTQDGKPDPFPADRLLLSLNTSSTGYIYDADSSKLDGEWAYPLSKYLPSPTSFPSGDGVEDGSFFFPLFFLPGDANQDNIVNGSDYLIWSDNFDLIATGKTFQEGDFNGDGKVDGDDLAIWQENLDLNFVTWWSY